ncbi:energy transducer TonB family protein [Sphingomonas sp. LT1P40]|uniref:energy transducer TonB family protein n=1 Tax=Alteristakelama amylovorans TaxID=3096166 RepID=UPI002FC68883
MRWAIGLAATSTLIQPAAAQNIPTAPASVVTSNGGWEIEYDSWRCVLHRKLIANGAPARFEMILEPLEPTVWLHMTIAGGGGARNDGDAVMTIDGQRVPGTLHYNLKPDKNERRREYMLNLDRHKLSDVKRTMRFWTRRAGDFELQLGGFPAAWKRTQACLSDLYVKLGIDEAEVAKIATKPEGFLFDTVEYPGGEADFALLYWITAEGRVDKCEMLKQSGDPRVDKLCDKIIAKAKFKPARTSTGQPIRAPKFEHVRIRVTTVMTPG